MSTKYLDSVGLTYLWGKIKAYVDAHGGNVDSTSVPTASKVAEFDTYAHMNSADMTAQEVQDFVDGLNVSGINVVDYIIDQGTSGIWTYRKWQSGVYEAWGKYEASGMTLTTASAGTYYGSNGNKQIDLPSFSTSVECITASETISHSSGVYIYNVQVTADNKLSIDYRAHASSTNAICGGYFSVVGRWK